MNDAQEKAAKEQSRKQELMAQKLHEGEQQTQYN